jgi:hypothetical protein
LHGVREPFSPCRSLRALKYVVLGLDSVTEDTGVGRHLSVQVQFGSRWQPAVGKAGRESGESS